MARDEKVICPTCPFASGEKEKGNSKYPQSNGFTLKEVILDIHKEVKQQNGRIGKLENWRSYSVGIVSAVVVLATLWLKYG